jgi:7-keto-8-aminopelargonate synthetase-like enzyme
VYNLCSCSYLAVSWWPESQAAALEAMELMRIYQKDCALIFVSASMANVSIIPMIIGKGDVIFSENENHITIIQGIKLSGADVHPYSRHHIDKLEEEIAQIKQGEPDKRILSISCGVFSMNCEVCPLPALIAVKEKHRCYLMLDEAHALGAVGIRGLALPICPIGGIS